MLVHWLAIHRARRNLLLGFSKDNGTARAPLGSNQGIRQASRRLSYLVDYGMGNNRKEYGTAWADVHAIQLLLSTCLLCGWDTTSLPVLGRCHIDKLECGPMPNVMAALLNIGGVLCSTPQSLADAHY